MTTFTRAELLAWRALLDAALDQPQPTRALKRAIAAVTAPQADQPKPTRDGRIKPPRGTQRRARLAEMVALFREDRAA